jgi:hypothetical protein
MKRLLLPALAGLMLLGATHGASAAATLDKASVEKFVATLDDIHALGKEMKASGKDQAMQEKIAAAAAKEKEISPYVLAVNTMKKEFPDDYKKLGKIAKDHGLSSQEEWAATGDKVMEAYMSSKMDAAAYQSLDAAKAQMTPEVLAKMPPETVARMQQSIAMMEKMKDVPAENREVIAPYKDKIDSFMAKEAQAQAEGATQAE